jgi:hypothetical protein
MTVVMTYPRRHQHEGPPPPDTTAQRIHDQAQDLSVKLRQVGHGWSYLAQLEYFELTIGEFPSRLDMLVRALEPRFAQKTLANKSGAWFACLQTAQSKLARIDDVAPMFRSLYPDARRLKELCQKLLQSGKWPRDLRVLMENAIAALGDFSSRVRSGRGSGG